MATELDKICRICMQSGPDMLLLFDEQHGDTETQTNIADMITACTIYKVDRLDELPQLVCAACGANVKQAYRFKRTCEQTHRKLLHLLGKSQVQSNERTGQAKATQTEITSMYPCERCDQKFFSYDNLKHHRDVHHKGSAMTCRFCAKSFNRIGYLKSHIAIFHPGAGYRSHNQCHLCDKQFTRREHLRRHLTVVHKLNARESAENDNDDDHRDEDVLADESDDDQNESLRYLENVLLADGHVKREADEMPNFQISTGKEGFIEVLLDANEMKGVEERLIEAVEDVLPPNVLPPMENHDAQSSTKADDLSPPPLHKEEPPGRRKHDKRNKSPQTAATCTELTTHMNVEHAASKAYTCTECNEEFAHVTEYKRHMDETHSRKQHACQICRKTFTTKVYLQRHIAIHERKRYVCKECSGSYITKDELAQHIKTNGHDKPLLCPECGLRCKTSNILMIHMRRHNGEKPFKCKFCSKGFPRMDDVRVHEKYHTNEKSHFCETCGKGFQRKYNLTIHRRVHTGERPYKCPHCTQAFAQGNDLKAHIRRHTGERFGCEICAATFLQGYQMRQHKLEQHGIRETPPTQRVKKFTSPEEQQQQIQHNLQKQRDNVDNA